MLSSKIFVLIVEDDLLSADLMRTLLIGEGYQADCVDSVAEAKKMLREQQYQIIICDISLPDGKGSDVLSAVDKSRCHAIAISGYSSEEDVQAARNAGFDTYLVKPIDIADLLEALRKLQTNQP